MIECPKCRMVYERQVKFCERCRYRFTGHDHRRSSPLVTILLITVGIAFTMAVMLAAFGGKRDVQASTTPVHKVVSIGETTNVKAGSFCGSTPEALDQMESWSARNDTGEVARILLKTRSVFLDKGMLVKVLEDRGFMIRQDRVRIVGGVALNDPRLGRECWIEAETIEGPVK